MSQLVSLRTVLRLLGSGLLLLGLGACSNGDGGTGLDADPEITLALGLSATDVLPGESVQVEGTLVRSEGYTGLVVMSVADEPPGVSVSIQDEVTSGLVTTAVIVLEVGTGVAPGTYPLTVRATGSGVEESTAVFTLTVSPLPGFQLTLPQTSLEVDLGNEGQVDVDIVRTNFSGPISLTLEGPDPAPPAGSAPARGPLPQGVTGTFSPNPITGDQTTLLVEVGGGVTPGTYALTIRGTAEGAENRTATLSLTVNDGPLNLTMDPVEIAVGGSHACTIDDQGAAFCWGSDSHGQVGDDPDLLTEFTPSPVAGGHAFAALANGFGATYSCALDQGGDAFCWGSNNFGQLGDGAFTGSAANPAPVAVAGGFTFVSLTAGLATTCGLTGTGTAYCWGSDSDTQLGDGPVIAARALPNPVAGGLTFTQLSVGERHVCGLDPHGAAYCWGADDTGQLGNGQPLLPAHTPTAVTGGPSFTRIAAGGAHTCALDPIGLAYCWGQDSLAEQLGDGVGATDQVVPVQVTGSRLYVDIVAGTAHTCALTSTRDVYCWGDDSDGQLGNDGVLDNDQWDPVRVSGGHKFRSISAGGNTTCGVTSSDQVFCWGDDGVEQVGNGPGATDQAVPVQIFLPS